MSTYWALCCFHIPSLAPPHTTLLSIALRTKLHSLTMALKDVLVLPYVHGLICNYSPPRTLLPAILASVLLLEYVSLPPTLYLAFLQLRLGFPRSLPGQPRLRLEVLPS